MSRRNLIVSGRWIGKSAKDRSVQGLVRHDGTVQGVAGGDDGEVELFDGFFEVVLICRGAVGLVNGGDAFKRFTDDFKSSGVHVVWAGSGETRRSYRGVVGGLGKGLERKVEN